MDFADTQTERVALGAHAQRVVVSRDLTSGASVRPEHDITYSTGNNGQIICVDFSETAPLQRYTSSFIVHLETAHAHY